MTGGNIRFLLQHMRASGLDRLVRSRVNAGALYLGCSAGAIVAHKPSACHTYTVLCGVRLYVCA